MLEETKLIGRRSFLKLSVAGLVLLGVPSCGSGGDDGEDENDGDQNDRDDQNGGDDDD